MTRSETIMGEIEIREMKAKIDRGIILAQERLVARIKRDNGYLIVSKGGKVIRLMAKDM